MCNIQLYVLIYLQISTISWIGAYKKSGSLQKEENKKYEDFVESQYKFYAIRFSKLRVKLYAISRKDES